MRSFFNLHTLFYTLFFVSKDVRKNVLGLVHPSLNVIKTLPGFLFLILFLGYYIYIAIFFEEKITFIVLILSIYLFVQDFFKTNLNLLLESENSIFDSIKDISFPVILLCIQQMSMMFENGTFNNLNYILLSLIIIPIYSILFFMVFSLFFFFILFGYFDISMHVFVN